MRLLQILERWILVLLRDDLVYLIPRDSNFSPEKEFCRQALHYDLQYAAGLICSLLWRSQLCVLPKAKGCCAI